MSNGTKRSPWVYIGCGCAVIIALIVVGIAVAGFMGVRTFKQFAEDMKDPVARAERAAEMLGTDGLPAGYHAQVSFSIPFVLEMALLTDGTPVTEENDQGMREFANMLAFIEIRDFEEGKDFDRYLDGEMNRPAIFDEVDINLDLNLIEPLGRGNFVLGEQEVRWVAQTGDMDVDHGRVAGIVTLAGVECPENDKRMRILAWFQRQESVDAEALRADPQGTPADGDAFQALVRDFDMCAQ